VKFAFIAAKMAEFPITVLCRVLEVSRAGFYACIGRPPPPRAVEDEKLAVLVREAHEQSRKTYGSPRVQAELADTHGVYVSRGGTGPSRSPIPEQADRPFRRKPITDSGASRSLNARPGEALGVSTLEA
jgi:hypothetical protein